MEIRIKGRIVRELRRERFWTQEDLAEACGLHPRTVQRLETVGTSSAQTARAIAQALGIEPSELKHGHAAGELDAADLSGVLKGTGVAFLWIALSALVFVPTSSGPALTSLIAGAGFVSFAIGIGLYDEGLRRS